MNNDRDIRDNDRNVTDQDMRQSQRGTQTTQRQKTERGEIPGNPEIDDDAMIDEAGE